jgi:UDP-glucose-4-epimerase GalE
MKHILVTGGAGYIGSHTSKLLASYGFIPVVVDNLVYGHASSAKWGPLIEADINDREAIKNTIEKYSIKDVIHFAAYAYVGESMINPRKYYLNNITSTLALLNQCVDSNVKNFVFSSTCATYGIPNHTPINEETSQIPINPYGYTKLVVEKMLQDYSRSYGLKTIALRYFNACGADWDLDVGEDHSPETHLIPLALKAILDSSYVLQIFGSDYPTKDGSCIRDYVHVLDLADAHILGLNYLDQKEAGFYGCFNLGTSKGNSIFEVIKTIETVTKQSVKYRLTQRRSGDPPELVADSRKANEQLGWFPKNSSLNQIIESAWNWETRGRNRIK